MGHYYEQDYSPVERLINELIMLVGHMVESGLDFVWNNLDKFFWAGVIFIVFAPLGFIIMSCAADWAQEINAIFGTNFKFDMFNWMEQRFNRTESHSNRSYQTYPPRPNPPKVSDPKAMVILPFRNVNYHSKFRFQKQWWTKISFKSALPDEGSTQEVEGDILVGVFLKDLTEAQKEYMVKV